MSNKHTLDPWVLTGSGDGNGSKIWNGNAVVDLVAVVAPRPTDAEAYANALLIKAAPKLLAAAKAALACIEKHVPVTEFAPREWLRSAIAEAGGS